jgi:type II secretory pathway predicted ATPase ExeA
MYESFFQLKQRPFAAAPRVDRYFPGKAIESSRLAIARSIERAEGAALLIGPAGTGKTLLCHVLSEQFRSQFSVALLSNGHLDNRRELLQAILFELGLPYRRLEEGELRLSLIDHVSNDQAARGGLLLIVDEAHTLSARLLEEVRLISNLVRNGSPRVRLVLAGNPLLEEKLADPALETLSQRIATRCYLEPFDYDESQQYVLAQMSTHGGDAGQVFSPDALEAIYRMTDGVPRLINQVCDHVLMMAYAGGRQQIDQAGIEEAWSDLQQLPTPSHKVGGVAVRGKAGNEDFIEFGRLDEEPYTTTPTELSRDDAYFEPPGEVGAAAEATLLIHQIDDHLADLERDFVGPPATLAVAQNRDWSANPFNEQFDEEEVLIDRYTSIDAKAAGELKQVESEDSRTLAALLGPFDRAESPQLSIVGSPSLIEDEPRGATPAVFLEAHALSTPNPLASFSASTLELPVPVPSVGSLSADDDEIADNWSDKATVTPRQLHSPHSEEDVDLMIVEDDPRPESRPHSAWRASQVRRQEFRQLFSLLRRG